MPSKNSIPLDEAQVRLAVNAMLKHLSAINAASGRKDLLGEDMRQPIHMSVHLKKLPGRASNKPVRIKIPHTLLDPQDGITCCLIVADPAAEFKDKLAASPVPGFAKVISVSKLRSDYREHKSRAALLGAYDAFFADDRVVRMMPQLLGTLFFRKKKHPAPVQLTGKGWARELAMARDATYVHVGWGQTAAVRVGRAHMPADAIVANIMAAAAGAVNEMPGKWRNVAAVGIGATGTVELPVWKSLPRNTRPIISSSGGVDDVGDLGSNDSDVSEEEESQLPPKVVKSGAGVKRKRSTPETGGSEHDSDSDVAALEKLLAEASDDENEGESEAVAAAVAASHARTVAARRVAKEKSREKLHTTGLGSKVTGRQRPVSGSNTSHAMTDAVQAPRALKPASLLSRAGIQQLREEAALKDAQGLKRVESKPAAAHAEVATQPPQQKVKEKSKVKSQKS